MDIDLVAKNSRLDPEASGALTADSQAVAPHSLTLVEGRKDVKSATVSGSRFTMRALPPIPRSPFSIQPDYLSGRSRLSLAGGDVT